MPPKKPRSYGRQAEGKTVKSVSIQDKVAALAEAEAKRLGISFSAFVEGVLTGKIKPPPGTSVAMFAAIGTGAGSGCLIPLAGLAGLAYLLA